MTNDSLTSISVTKTVMMGVKVMTERYKKYSHKKQMSVQKGVTETIHEFSCTTMIAKHLT